MAAAEHVRDLVQPIIEQNHAELYDLEYESGILRVLVDQDGGINVDTVGELSRLISDALDRDDPIPDSKYLLEVSSPGIERKLRTPAHYEAQLGNTIALKVRHPVEMADGTNTRRVQGEVLSSDDGGIDLAYEGRTVHFTYADIETARSVYDWSQATSESRLKALEPTADDDDDEFSDDDDDAVVDEAEAAVTLPKPQPKKKKSSTPPAPKKKKKAAAR